ncbi:hypothetical protein M5689_020117 [Euphorbia peplus]|nr:hypothetical protein M5689_020117 [Euphorbia peplus]
MGNQLCGLTLTDNCTSDIARPDIEEKDENEDEVDVWFYVSMAFGFVFGFCSVQGSLIFIRKWKHFYFHFVYYLGEKIWWNFNHKFH